MLLCLGLLVRSLRRCAATVCVLQFKLERKQIIAVFQVSTSNWNYSKCSTHLFNFTAKAFRLRKSLSLLSKQKKPGGQRIIGITRVSPCEVMVDNRQDLRKYMRTEQTLNADQYVLKAFQSHYECVERLLYIFSLSIFAPFVRNLLNIDQIRECIFIEKSNTGKTRKMEHNEKKMKKTNRSVT